MGGVMPHLSEIKRQLQSIKPLANNGKGWTKNGLKKRQPCTFGYVLYLWLAFKGLVGEYSYNDLVKARKAYQSCDGVEVVNGQLPIDEKLFYLGQDIHKDVYESKPIKMYML